MRVMRMLNTTLLPAGVIALAACGGEGERYRAVVVPDGLTWQEAKQRAEADGGHLVTITSAEENARVYSLIAENPDFWVNVDVTTTVDGEETAIQVSLGPWIGLYQPPGSPEPAGGWIWVTGETSDYTNWFGEVVVEAAEPNNLGGVEHFGHFFTQGLDARGDTWNDMVNSVADFAEVGVEFVGDVHDPRGYIVEFEP